MLVLRISLLSKAVGWLVRGRLQVERHDIYFKTVIVKREFGFTCFKDGSSKQDSKLKVGFAKPTLPNRDLISVPARTKMES